MALLASDVALENQTEVRAAGVGQSDEERVDWGPGGVATDPVSPTQPH